MLQASVVHIRTRTAETLRPSSYARGQHKTGLFCLSDSKRCAWEVRSNNKAFFLAGIFSGDIHLADNVASERFQPHKCWTNARTMLCKNSLRTPRYWTIYRRRFLYRSLLYAGELHGRETFFLHALRKCTALSKTCSF